MPAVKLVCLCAVATVGAFLGGCGGEGAPQTDYISEAALEGAMERATFAAGCFWGVEATFRQVKGVTSTQVGYTGGSLENPTYRDVCAGKTGHAEAVQLTYDPAQVSYEDLLNVFWNCHDPTTLNRQGPDVGSQYRSAIFYHSPEQCDVAAASKGRLAASGTYDSPIVTEITPATPFYRAEEYHQRYNEKHGVAACGIVQPKAQQTTASPEPDQAGQPVAGKVARTDEEWRRMLTPEQYRITRQKDTEPAFSGKYYDFKGNGVYHCVGCGNPLFSSKAKYDSGTGWPSFWEPIAPASVEKAEDRSLLTVRTEVLCSRCEAHLGHVFADRLPVTGLRYCINSVAVEFREDKPR